jgi:hypothetical protein
MRGLTFPFGEVANLFHCRRSPEAVAPFAVIGTNQASDLSLARVPPVRSFLKKPRSSIVLKYPEEFLKNIIGESRWREKRVLGPVAPYPEAREAVIAALRDLDAASASVPALRVHGGEGAPDDV